MIAMDLMHQTVWMHTYGDAFLLPAAHVALNMRSALGQDGSVDSAEQQWRESTCCSCDRVVLCEKVWILPVSVDSIQVPPPHRDGVACRRRKGDIRQGVRVLESSDENRLNESTWRGGGLWRGIQPLTWALSSTYSSHSSSAHSLLILPQCPSLSDSDDEWTSPLPQLHIWKFATVDTIQKAKSSNAHVRCKVSLAGSHASPGLIWCSVRRCLG